MQEEYNAQGGSLMNEERYIDRFWKWHK
ncbi:hypothetical protein COMA2_20356 [Candidatus Nitrospira nitrificans]|uniref:Uncharacterized protein n=1 Tax=Candidatus Nitrospira nitrificans TaxID=1742973 RepID=A0A0S4LD54_9BACT|nr:hypothetical protein COMA2_20356 [Candidatus Nitrospira nitrificans]